jgi:hypothetical protein
MPQQRVVELDAMTDQPFAVVDQQPQVEFRSSRCAVGKD